MLQAEPTDLVMKHEGPREMLSPRQTVESNLIEKQETASVTQPLGPQFIPRFLDHVVQIFREI